MKENQEAYYYNKKEVMDDIDETNLWLLMSEPFYSHLFSGLNKEVRMDIPTACIAYHPDSAFLGLWVNPKFWNENLKGKTDTETKNYKFGLIKHEILHIVFKHMFRAKEFQDKKLFNVAADLVVNQHILPNQLIEGACTLSQFPDFNLKTGEALEYYYVRIKEEWEKVQKNKEKGDKNENNSQDNLENYMNQDDNHSEWGELSNELEGIKDLIQAKLDNQLAEMAKKLNSSNQWGNLPGFLKDYITQQIAVKVSVVNWKQVLKRFTTSSQTSYIKNTIRRPSKRYGTCPGTKIKHKQRILVAIDTSGSVDNDSLQEFFGEIRHIFKQGVHIRIIECDTQIHAEYDYKGIPPNQITGRGGTCFEAPFVYAQDYNPDAIIYFTDGECYPPKTKVRTNKVMWVLCKNNGMQLEDFKNQGFEGVIVKMN